MKKRTYIQPEMEVAVVAMSELMIPSSPGLDQNTQYNPAPKRTEVF